jgi:hypothetical protein
VDRLSAATRKGMKVFAVVGRDHVAHQADALRCSLADTSSPIASR